MRHPVRFDLACRIPVHLTSGSAEDTLWGGTNVPRASDFVQDFDKCFEMIELSNGCAAVADGFSVFFSYVNLF